MAVVVDTDHLIELERATSRAETLEALIADEERAISVITVSELLHGAFRADGAQRARRLVFVERILSRIECLPVDETVARLHAALGADLARSGSAIGTHDLWIAATALARGAGVATHNARDFARVPSLRVVTSG
jgi:tRNA(fMet)-specific endonuclease VapC